MGNHLLSIHHPYFAPWLGYLAKMHLSSLFVILDDVNFRRNHLNRSHILTPDGRLAWFGVPTNGSTRKPYNTVKIAPNYDPRKMLRRIRHDYMTSPYIAENIVVLEEYLDHFRPGGFLLEANISSVNFLLSVLDLKSPEIRRSSSFHPVTDRTDRVIKVCNQYPDLDLLIGDGGMKKVHDFERIEAERVNVKTLAYFARHPEYSQHQCMRSTLGFVPGISCFDALFNIGIEETAALVETASNLIV